MARELPVSQHSSHKEAPGGPRWQCEGEGEGQGGQTSPSWSLSCCVMLGNLLCFPEMISNMRCDEDTQDKDT